MIETNEQYELQRWTEASFSYWRNRNIDNALFFWQLGWIIGIDWSC